MRNDQFRYWIDARNNQNLKTVAPMPSYDIAMCNSQSRSIYPKPDNRKVV